MAPAKDGDADVLKLFLGGDVMTGRGIDQALPHPNAPDLYERWVQHACDYVTLAERRNGAFPKPVSYDYPWGDALEELRRQQPQARIVNLETSITTSPHYQPAKGIHYRMNPANVGCLTAAGLDCCVLANNHVLDWGVEGLLDTLDVLERAGIRLAGAGRDSFEAAAPAVLPLAAGRRLLVFGWAVASSGVADGWAATEAKPGVSFLPEASRAQADRMAAVVAAHRRQVDRVVVSLHWGGNWGYGIAQAHREMAHRLIDQGSADVVHGHSSHHPLAVEVYRNRPIIYGCGDLLNDYEGIRGNETFRGDLAFMYFPTLDVASGELTRLELAPMQIRRFRLTRCSEADFRWLARRLAEQSAPFGVTVEPDDAQDRLSLAWR